MIYLQLIFNNWIYKSKDDTQWCKNCKTKIFTPKRIKKILYSPLLWMGFNCLRHKSYEEAVYFLLLSSQKFLVLI